MNEEEFKSTEDWERKTVPIGTLPTPAGEPSQTLEARTKKCVHCGIVKVAEDFYQNQKYKGGLSSWCVKCSREGAKLSVRRHKKYPRRSRATKKIWAERKAGLRPMPAFFKRRGTGSQQALVKEPTLKSEGLVSELKEIKQAVETLLKFLGE